MSSDVENPAQTPATEEAAKPAMRATAPRALLADDVALGRAQLADGLFLLAERTLRRAIDELDERARLAPPESEERALDDARLALAEALWRQGRPAAAGSVLEEIRALAPGRRPLARLIEAESAAARGDVSRGMTLMEELVDEIGVEEAWELRAGVAGRLTWPEPESFAVAPARPAERAGAPALPPLHDAPPTAVEATAADARRRLAAAERALGDGEERAAEDHLALALRLDPAIAFDALALLEPRMGDSADPRRLVLYGDLLAATGRRADAEAAYRRAAGGDQV